MVPFFRGVRAKKKGREATPPRGAKPPHRSRSDLYLGVGYPSVRQFFAVKLFQILTESNETLQKLGLGQTGRLGFGGFAIGHREAELLCAEGEKMGVFAVFGNLKAIKDPNRWSRAPQSMCRYPRECWSSCLRHLPTAGVCDQGLGTSIRLLLTAGVCEQHLGGYLRLLLTAGVCEQRSGGLP